MYDDTAAITHSLISLSFCEEANRYKFELDI
jgi:hypothetical protein